MNTRKIFAALIALALLLFWADAASAQEREGWDVYRLVSTGPDGVAKAATPTTADSVALDYTELDPLNIPGIQILEPGTYSLNTSPEDNIYFKEGVHWITGDNVILGKVFYAPSANVLKLPEAMVQIGDLNGELTQLIGKGPDHGSFALGSVGGKITIHNAVATGHEWAPDFITDTEFPLSHSMEFRIEIRNYYAVKNLKGCVIRLGENYSNTYTKVYFYMENALFVKNIKGDFSVATSDSSRLHLMLKDARMLNPVKPLYLGYFGPQHQLEFVDLRTSFNIFDPQLSPEWLTEHQNDRTLFFRETRPGGIIGTPNIVQRWPRETPLSVLDFTGNSEVDIGDVLYLAADLGAEVGTTRFGHFYDTDTSGFVDMTDLARVTLGYLGLPTEIPLSDIRLDNGKVEELKPKVITLAGEIHKKYPEVEKAIMDDPQFGKFINIFLEPTAVLDESTAVPTNLALEQNYPNPFNSQTTIRFAIGRSGKVQLVVRDLLGRVVSTLTHAYLEADIYSEKWDGKDANGLDIASGVYLYELRTESERMIRKLMILR